ncbi:MAG: hypothetical protein KUG78_16065 [Kangiellaceae bacterium]|nr:hypothetical protein [Kangiellaceae bacterium]
MKKCVLLTMDNLDEFDCYDSLLHKPLKELGWQAHDISWKDSVINWDEFDAVIIRSPWDYQEYCEEFLAVLDKIEKSSALLMNNIDLVRWNINKKYLAALQQKGITLVPTLWSNNLESNDLENAFVHFETTMLIVKPCISAGAYDTFKLNKEQAADQNSELMELFFNRDFMIQPFVENIVKEGEFSLFYFNHQFSHCIIKKPKKNDFRVQEEYGGQLTLVEPETKLLAAAEKVIDALPYPAMFARFDFVRIDDEFAIMEAELIEPSLYFNMDDQSAERFSKAFIKYYANA